ncbi:hypothetical protein OSB04_024404 [Centaurea solstitialis]|uniref:Putative plant transposon protein domain-containing protein n=1 Tax=Centaurea solstitialis TaxID=347529 RepID=A0AA38W333_9ASTR|nr:hypothetical protein OSB04_024404 [Centaurea solstitialis]
MQRRGVYPERSLNLDAIPLPALRATAEARGWMDLISQPGPYDPMLVREFYAAMIPPIFNRHSTVIVRGVTVQISVDDICQHFHLRRPNGVDITTGISPIPGVEPHDVYSHTISRSLRRNGEARWEIVNYEIKKSKLPYDLAMWMLFIKHSILPSLHHTNADAHVARVLYCIQHNLPLDIGHIIHLAILDVGGRQEQRILLFPSLITHFCERAGVPRIDRIEGEIPIGCHAYTRFLSASGDAVVDEDVQIPEGNADVAVEDHDATDVAHADPSDREDRSDWPPYAVSLCREMLQGFASIRRLILATHQAEAARTETGTSSQGEQTRRPRYNPMKDLSDHREHIIEVGCLSGFEDSSLEATFGASWEPLGRRITWRSNSQELFIIILEFSIESNHQLHDAKLLISNAKRVQKQESSTIWTLRSANRISAYEKKYVPSDSDSEPNYATDYDSDLPKGLTFTLDDLTLRDPIYLNDEDEYDEEEHKQGDYAELVIPPNDKKGKERWKRRMKEKIFPNAPTSC